MKESKYFFFHYYKTYKDFTYNDFAYDMNKCVITYMFLFTVLSKISYK